MLDCIQMTSKYSINSIQNLINEILYRCERKKLKCEVTDWKFWKNIDQNIIVKGYNILALNKIWASPKPWAYCQRSVPLLLHKTSSVVVAYYCSACMSSILSSCGKSAIMARTRESYP